MHLKKLRDTIADKTMVLAIVLSALLLAVIGIVLFIRSLTILETKSLQDLFLSSTWVPSMGQFGYMLPILGTLSVTFIAMAIAVPLSIMSALYLAEYAAEGVRSKVLPLIDLLAGIPPVVYGVWGVLIIVPIVSSLSLALSKYDIPLLASKGNTTGFSILSGGVVLAIMVFPIIISISEQVFRAVPSHIKEASMNLGATRWQTIKHVNIRIAVSGIAAAVILGFSRAFGETIAVLMVVGNVPKLPTSLFDPAYPLTALIANTYGEMMSIPLYDSALLFAAFLLMLVILIFTIAARLILMRIEERMANG